MIEAILTFIGCAIALLIVLVAIWAFILVPVQHAMDEGISYFEALKRIF